MGVFRETDIKWKGQTYKLVPSMALLRAIELQGISLMHVEWQVATGKPQASLMSTVIAIVLADAGAEVTEEEIYQEIRSADPSDVLALYRQVMTAISPEDKKAKKAAAPADKEE